MKSLLIKIKKNWKRGLIVGMAVMMLSTVVISDYQEANEVQAVAIVDDAVLLLIALFAAAGITITSMQLLDAFRNNPSDVKNPLKDWLESGSGKSYDDWLDDRVKEIALRDGFIDENGEWTGKTVEGINPSEPDPDDEDPDKTDWNDIKRQIKKIKGRENLHAFLTGAFGSALAVNVGIKFKQLQDAQVKQELEKQEMNETIKNLIEENKEEYPYYTTYKVYTEFKTIYHNLVLSKKNTYKTLINEDGSYWSVSAYSYNLIGYKYLSKDKSEKDIIDSESSILYRWKAKTSQPNDFTLVNSGSFLYPAYLHSPSLDNPNGSYLYTTDYSTNQPVYKSTALVRSLFGVAVGGTMAGLSQLDTSDADTSSDFKNAEDTPPVNDDIRVPSYDDLGQYFDDLSNAQTEEEKQKAIDDFIQNLKNPATDPVPDPNPDPDPNPNPDPDPNPDPNPNPNPDPDPNPDTDTDNSEDMKDKVKDETKRKFLLPETITRKFPFCIPFDLVDAFTVLGSADRKAPRVEFPLKSERFNIDYTFVIDMVKFESVAQILRSMELLLFIVGLVMATRGLIKG